MFQAPSSESLSSRQAITRIFRSHADVGAADHHFGRERTGIAFQSDWYHKLSNAARTIARR
ncbi:MAG: hypothetical protein U0892_03275 [Pirellulales bacterium]